ncbi:MAG: alpha-hydroxy-acid oxidizing protein [Alphaproteobacteria bacterium]|nr:alpha-hydroxy-acid oxidizing protein [Alphaproteobacteria bacterium]
MDVSIEDLRLRAKRRLPRTLFEFIDGGAQDERTLRANTGDFDRWLMVPQQCVDVSQRPLGTTILGKAATLPLVIAPTGMAGLFRRKGELQAARAARAAGIPYTLSTMASVTIEEVGRDAAASAGDLWFQLYVQKDRGLTRSLVERAKAAGFRVLAVTIDLQQQGQRERDVRNGLTIPPRITLANMLDMTRRLPWIADVLLGPRLTFANFEGTANEKKGLTTLSKHINASFDPALTWADIAAFKQLWGGPVAVKGVLSAEDARRAVDAGCDGVIVSNHGGRQLDCVPSAVAALPGIVDAVAGRAEVIVDGGVRRGSDVIKALALGARACMIGRAMLWGLASGGEAGVGRTLQILKGQIDNGLALLGRPGIASLDRTALAPVDAYAPQAESGRNQRAY